MLDSAFSTGIHDVRQTALICMQKIHFLRASVTKHVYEQRACAVQSLVQEDTYLTIHWKMRERESQREWERASNVVIDVFVYVIQTSSKLQLQKDNKRFPVLQRGGSQFLNFHTFFDLIPLKKLQYCHFLFDLKFNHPPPPTPLYYNGNAIITHH